MLPLVSIVVPAYNVESFLDQTLTSIKSQTFLDWQVVVVNDGSTDGTAAVAAKWISDHRFRLVTQENRGVSAARNRGARESETATKYIAFLDGDDLWEPDSLSLLVAAAESNPGFVGAHGRSRYVEEDGTPVLVNKLDIPRKHISGYRRLKNAQGDPTDFDVLAFMLPINVGNVIVKRNIFDQVGGFDQSMRYSEDWDLWLRLSLIAPFAYVDHLVLNYRLRVGSAMNKISQDTKALVRQDYEVRKKLIETPSLTPIQRTTAIRSQPIWFLKMYAAEQLRRRQPSSALATILQLPVSAMAALLDRT